MTTTPDEQPADAIPQDVAAASAAPAASIAENAAPAENGDLSLAGEAMNLLSDHKGKLAIGVAATLGLMVYYGWREKRLAKTDPEEYARLQRLKALVRNSDAQPRHKHKSTRKTAAPTPADPVPEADAGADAQESPDAAPEFR